MFGIHFTFCIFLIYTALIALLILKKLHSNVKIKDINQEYEANQIG